MGKLTHLLAAAVLAATATAAFAGTAAAHTPYIKADCTPEGTVLSVRLEAYSANVVNTVTVTDGEEVLAEEEFGVRYEGEWTVSAEVDHTFTIAVVAGDDASGKRGWTFTRHVEEAACVVPTTTTTAPETTTTTTAVAPTTTTEAPATTSAQAPPPSAAPTSPAPAEDELADTGASIALPLALGALLLVGGVAALVLVRRRAAAE
ncbi:LPXTG cell wall anchor domain-containing protein [Actinokineospora sp. NPDC004072]